MEDDLQHRQPDQHKNQKYIGTIKKINLNWLGHKSKLTWFECFYGLGVKMFQVSFKYQRSIHEPYLAGFDMLVISMKNS